MTVLPEEWVDYVFLEPDKRDPTIPLKILTGPYKDVTLCFGTVRLVEDEYRDIATLRFTYKVLSPEAKVKSLNKDPVFKEYIGRVLNNVILEATNESGESNSEIFDEEPKLREKGSSVSKD